MSQNSAIAWCDATWNPFFGCSKVSDGCTNCYALGLAWRHENNPKSPYYHTGIAEKRNGKVLWTGKVVAAEDALTRPMRWRKPQRIFVNSMSDLFHEDIPDKLIDEVFAVMALCPQHTFIVLTKRAERMREYLSSGRATAVGMETFDLTLGSLCRDASSNVGTGVMLTGDIAHLKAWPLSNVWLGVSVEDQKNWEARRDYLYKTPAAVKFLSCEPLLGNIWLADNIEWLNWVIVGSESGHRARYFDDAWARDIRDQCQLAGVPFFFKQHIINGKKVETPKLDGQRWTQYPGDKTGRP